MDTPCTQLDLATVEGKVKYEEVKRPGALKRLQVVGLGEEEKMKTTAMEMLEARSDYILVLRKVRRLGDDEDL